jgi:uncharacterized protein YijF (DUF1287 family)
MVLAALLCLPGSSLAASNARQLVAAARAQIGVTKSYDPAYVALKYPGGDVPMETGVCSDVVVRAFRKLNLDLQQLVHEDMKAGFPQYPQKWGLKKPDPNIDHRRVPNLMKYFERRGVAAKISKRAGDYQAGDVVAWDLGQGITHIGIVSDQVTANGTPLIIHNIGQGAQEEEVLFRYEIIGHYRCWPERRR